LCDHGQWVGPQPRRRGPGFDRAGAGGSVIPNFIFKPTCSMSASSLGPRRHRPRPPTARARESRRRRCLQSGCAPAPTRPMTCTTRSGDSRVTSLNPCGPVPRTTRSRRSSSSAAPQKGKSNRRKLGPFVRDRFQPHPTAVRAPTAACARPAPRRGQISTLRRAQRLAATPPQRLGQAARAARPWGDRRYRAPSRPRQQGRQSGARRRRGARRAPLLPPKNKGKSCTARLTPCVAAPLRTTLLPRPSSSAAVPVTPWLCSASRPGLAR
jgi:hypothetical protein